MNIHLIATGGAVMHNLALALQKNGHVVTGSDDEIYSPAKERLEKTGLLPPKFGWFPEKITNSLDLVILGMHAKADNPELLRAQELGLRVLSFPEFIYEHAKDKRRIVVAGSHGKTTTTAMIMHVLQKRNIPFDYLVGAQLEGFDTMVQLSDAPIMVIEGDEYLSSPLDRRPKFLHYRPHIAIVTGIEWDHINVFPTFEEYKRQFGLLLENMEPNGSLIFDEKDPHLREIVNRSAANIYATPYAGLPYRILHGKAVIIWHEGLRFGFEIFGKHNFANLNAAMLACQEVGISEMDFLEEAETFKGAAKRLQLLVETKKSAAWLDFAHAPSKVRATVSAVKSLHPNRQLVACAELHTFSSLNKDFLPQYAHTMDAADVACVFYSPHTLEMKKMEAIGPSEIRQAFARPDLEVFKQRADLEAFLKKQTWKDANLLMMTSGNFGGMDVKEFVGGLM